MPEFIYTMKGLGKTYPPDGVVFKDVYLSFFHGAKIGVIGANGAGKSTLLKIMAGLEDAYEGEATLSAGYTVGYLPQEPTLDSSKNVLGNVEEGVAEVRALLTKFDEINERFAEEMSPEEMEKVLEEQGKVQDAIEAAGAWDLDAKLEQAMDALRLPPPEAEVATLSGGERRRVEIARALTTEPTFVLLDEPFTGIDPIAIADIQKIVKDLKERGIGILITDHNVRETLQITDRAYIIRAGEIFRSGTPEELGDDQETREIYLGQNFRLDPAVAH